MGGQAGPPFLFASPTTFSRKKIIIFSSLNLKVFQVLSEYIYAWGKPVRVNFIDNSPGRAV